jgi:hypothetical protein
MGLAQSKIEIYINSYLNRCQNWKKEQALNLSEQIFHMSSSSLFKSTHFSRGFRQFLALATLKKLVHPFAKKL